VRLNTVPWQDSILDPEFIVSQCDQNTLLEVYRKIYEINAIYKGKKVWVNKSMQNVYYIEQFEKSGLSPLLIHLVRDGRDVSLSFKRTIIGEKHIYYLARQWKNDQEMSDYYVDRYGPERALRIKYEDLLHEPASQIKRICSFLNVPYTEKIFQYYTSNESFLAAQSGEMWSNLVKPIIKNNYNKYKKGLSPEEIEIFEIIASENLLKYGYQPEHDHKKLISGFSEEEIRKFNSVNEYLKQEALKYASSEELNRRVKQQQFLNSIKERSTIL
jgi:hypothetical protein